MPRGCYLDFNRTSCRMESFLDAFPVKRGTKSLEVVRKSTIEKVKAFCDPEKNAPDSRTADFGIRRIRYIDVGVRILRLLRFRYLLQAPEVGMYLSSSSVLFLACYYQS